MVSSLVSRLRRQTARARQTAEWLRQLPLPAIDANPYAAYQGRPVAFVRDVLHVSTLTGPQQAILEHLHIPPYKVLVPSGHDTGKTFVAACATVYWHYAYAPSVVLTTAPTKKEVEDLLWTEVRLLVARAELEPRFIGPAAPWMRGDSIDHYAKGIVAAKGVGIQGRHRPHTLFVLDEANDIPTLIWQQLYTMFDPDLGHAILAIFNPVSTTSHAYMEDQEVEDEEGKLRWHRFRLNALDHPNIQAELKGEKKPIPGAVSLHMVTDWIRDWCEPAVESDRKATDIEWPPGSGNWFHPGALFECRVMGLWPSSGSGVWSDALWEACFGPEPGWPLDRLPEIGADMATGKGDDYHAIHCRWGDVSLHHETANTMDPARIAGRLRALAADMAGFTYRARHPALAPPDPKAVPMKLDDDGTGNAIAAFLRAEGYNVQLVSAARAATRQEYPRMRDQLWFAVADRARSGHIRLGRLDRLTLRRLKAQLMAPEWEQNNSGQHAVEPKDDTKEKIGRSPDDADAFNLAFMEGLDYKAPEAVEERPQTTLGMFGR